LIDWLPRLFARIPANVHVKLLVAFLAMVLLLIVLGIVGLRTATEANQRAAELVRLQRHIAVYRQLQHDATVQLYNVASALLVPEEQTLHTTLRQLSVFGYDVDRLQVAAPGDVELLGRVQADYAHFVKVATQVVELIRAGKVAEGHAMQRDRASPLAERLARQMNELVNRAEAEMLASIDTSRGAYLSSRWTVIGFAVGSSALAMLLGFAISQSLIVPVKQINQRLGEIAAGDFSRNVDIANRDELGSLAANVNRMNGELRRVYEQLEAVNLHKSQFLANMSHELRTPLNAIIGFSEVLHERMFGELNAKQAEYVQDIYTSGRHLLALINDILDLAKIDSGRVELERSRFDLRLAIDNAVTLVRERAQRHGIALEVDAADSLGEIHADERKVKQILLNLLSNALKFTPDGGRVAVAAKRADGAAEISVADTGIGIAAADQELIFEEFRQAQAKPGQAREGTGLGLALTRKFVEMHGGRISVESEPGKGATFTFTLPEPS
jgi:signal transduction histidine kinase